MEKTARGQIIEEGKKRGIEVISIVPDLIDAFSYNGHTEYLCKQFISKTSAAALYITNNKEITKIFFKKAGLAVPEGESFGKTEVEDALAFAENLSWPLVMKPTASSKGDSVFANISDKEEFAKSWEQIAKKHEKILVEEMFEGEDYRIFSTQEKVIAATRRVPANVTGDGKRTIQELIQDKNTDDARLVQIEVDNIVIDFLNKSGYNLDSIPEKDKTVFLRKNANISTGGDIIDVTDSIHDSVKELAVKAVKAIPGLMYGGVDLMTKDITKKQSENSYTILEINASASIKMHHFPTIGIPRNVAKAIIDIMFPETI